MATVYELELTAILLYGVMKPKSLTSRFQYRVPMSCCTRKLMQMHLLMLLMLDALSTTNIVTVISIRERVLV